MSADDVLVILDRLERAGVEVWVEGGWGIDALVGYENRVHEDLDVVLPHDHWDAAVGALLRFGLSVDEERSHPPASLVLRDDALSVDLHDVRLLAEHFDVAVPPDLEASSR